jgi:hypothetical protein
MLHQFPDSASSRVDALHLSKPGIYPLNYGPRNSVIPYASDGAQLPKSPLARVGREIQAVLTVIPLLLDDPPTSEEHFMQNIACFRAPVKLPNNDRAQLETYYPFVRHLRIYERAIPPHPRQRQVNQTRKTLTVFGPRFPAIREKYRERRDLEQRFYAPRVPDEEDSRGVTGTNGLKRMGNYQGWNRERISLLRYFLSLTRDERQGASRGRRTN